MNADVIVDILLEDEAAEFVTSLPQEFFDSFHIICDREHGVHADREYTGHRLVYKNNEDGTRDFYGYIQKDDRGWRVTGVNDPQRSAPRAVIVGHRFSSPHLAARDLARRYYIVRQDCQ